MSRAGHNTRADQVDERDHDRGREGGDGGGHGGADGGGDDAGESPDRDDRQYWNARHRAGPVGGVPAILGSDLHRLPRRGRALDLAGGSGAAAVVLAARGLDVTIVDVSDIALDQAAGRAADLGLELTTIRVDLTVDPPPAGPWDVITCFHYLDRSLLATMAGQLAPGGLLVVVMATRSNLERWSRPGPRFLLEDGELPALLAQLDLVLYREGWNRDGRHQAEAMARRR